FLGKAGERMNKWRETAEKDWPFGPAGGGDNEQAGEHRRGPFGHGPRGDRDIPGVLPEVNEARRELKSAIADAIDGDEATQRRLADILRKAAELIRKRDVDL
ncbi:MAG: PadR family transcriptional regulator, partial [Hyphomicrobiales bacterium]|nr:PadR family transcriptional regulator [Hyphomicrobiales bacterium]